MTRMNESNTDLLMSFKLGNYDVQCYLLLQKTGILPDTVVYIRTVKKSLFSDNLFILNVFILLILAFGLILIYRTYE